MSYDEYVLGLTYDRGRFVTVARLRGSSVRGVYAGRRVDGGADVLITVHSGSWAPELIDRARIQSPGVTPLLFIGPPDGYKGPHPSMSWSRQGAIIELRPEGLPLDRTTSTAGRSDLLRFGRGLLDVTRAASDKSVELRGMRPETVYVVDEPTGWRLGGVAPRSVRVLSHEGDGPYGSPFEQHSYDAPEPFYADEYSSKAALFSWALVVWWAHTRRHAYRVTPNEPDDWTMAHDENRTEFPGPPEIGRILERVLVADPGRRPEIDEVQAEWSALDRT